MMSSDVGIDSPHMIQGYQVESKSGEDHLCIMPHPGLEVQIRYEDMAAEVESMIDPITQRPLIRVALKPHVQPQTRVDPALARLNIGDFGELMPPADPSPVMRW